MIEGLSQVLCNMEMERREDETLFALVIGEEQHTAWQLFSHRQLIHILVLTSFVNLIYHIHVCIHWYFGMMYIGHIPLLQLQPCLFVACALILLVVSYLFDVGKGG